ncbi:hypothetical protein [Brachyspira hampsonii]|nr:hypothetical protein [Brachyspira hampsonii]
MVYDYVIIGAGIYGLYSVNILYDEYNRAKIILSIFVIMPIYLMKE